jgi:DNA-binding transcriptional LysR family regulator
LQEILISTTYALPRLELRQLLALLAVVEENTFSAAAERLGYTQSAVSQQIAALERVVGAPLFDRPGGPRRVRLTPVGEALVVHARALLARLQAAQADVQALLAGERGTLRVGTLQSVGTKVLPRLLRRFREESPGIDLALLESHVPAELARGVEFGELDLSFSSLPLPDAPLAAQWVLDDPFVFVAPADAPEAARSSITIQEIARLPLIGLRDPGEHQELVELLQPASVPVNFVFRSNDNPTIQGFIAAGLGYGLLARLAVDESDPSVAVRPVRPSPAPRRLAVLWHAERQLPPAVQHFVSIATEVCEQLSQDWQRLS